MGRASARRGSRHEGNGVGLTAEQAGPLFHPFTQGDQSLARGYDGPGLGLAFVQRQLDTLGGTIRIEPSLPVVTRIVVTLPCT